jgi:hypothetical protein
MPQTGSRRSFMDGDARSKVGYGREPEKCSVRGLPRMTPSGSSQSEPRAGLERLLREVAAIRTGPFCERLIDEIGMAICPAVDRAKGAPTIFDCREGCWHRADLLNNAGDQMRAGTGDEASPVRRNGNGHPLEIASAARWKAICRPLSRLVAQRR